jgi:hypothetical protein
MMRRILQRILALSASLLLFGCAGAELELRIKATVESRPVPEAKVVVDGEPRGFTDGKGLFSGVMRRKPGAEVEVTVVGDIPGYRIKPWTETFVMKLPKSDARDVYSFDVQFSATRYVTIQAIDKGMPVAGAIVKAAGNEVGKTDANGQFPYEYATLPPGGVDLTVTKSGYAVWRKTGNLEPGQNIEAALSRQVLLTITALTEEYGQPSGIPGVMLSVNGRLEGRTDAKGVVSFPFEGEHGKRAEILLEAPGYIPSQWRTSVAPEGEMSIERYFYPVTPKPIRAGIYRFVSNTPDADLREAVQQAEAAVGDQLFAHACFIQVPARTLHEGMKAAKVGIEKMTAKGWRATPLRRTVDMIVLGSVSKDERGLLIETRFYTSGGKLVLSQLTRSRGAGGMKSAAKEITAAVLEKFPFEGTVTGTEGERYFINIGKIFNISRGTELSLLSPHAHETGRVSGYREAGRLKVTKSDANGSWAEVEDLMEGERISPGDRVVRRVIREADGDAAGNYIVLSAKGGVPPELSPLGAVNIYLNGEWMGSTEADGRADVPFPIGKTATIVLYKQGYRHVSEKIRVEDSDDDDVKEFVLNVHNSLFRIESEPAPADVFVDAKKIGRTPILDGKPVKMGSRRVTVSYGGDYRDWEEVIEFAEKTEDRTGPARVVLYKDYLRIGERALQQGNVNAAITAYQSAERGHPDYVEARHRLAQIYLDDLQDYEAAIREFENILSFPENQQFLYKKYAVAFTHLGQAYYERGSALVMKDRDGASKSFAKAIEHLKKAKQNARFFPVLHHDEAVHDTFYYTALAYHQLYLLTQKNATLNEARAAWREYFDFFPKSLEGHGTFEQQRDTAKKFRNEINTR